MSEQAALDPRGGSGGGGGSGGPAPAAGTTPYYVRKVRVGDRYKAFGEDGSGSALSAIAGNDGRISLGMELDSILLDVAPDLYGYFGAFVREDMNNALRQVREARAGGHDAHVHVTINHAERTVEIRDIGTNGMPVDVFRDIYTVLGRSGNLDGRESGQKGIGRFAFLGASDTKIVETHARSTGERYGFIMRGGKVFEPIPDDMLSIDGFGTRTSVCVDADHDFSELVPYARRIAAAATVPVYLTIVGRDGGNAERERIDGEGGLGCGCSDAMRIRTDDFEFTGCTRCSDLPNRPRHAQYLIGIPIDLNGPMNLGGYFSTTTLNILDERKYEPTTSRDYLSEDASGRISRNVESAVMDELRKIDWDGGSIYDVPDGICKIARSRPVIGSGSASSYVSGLVGPGARRLIELLRLQLMVLPKTDESEFGVQAPRAILPSNSRYSANMIRHMHLHDILKAAGDSPLSYAPDKSIRWRRAAWSHVASGKGPVIFLEGGDSWEEYERMGMKRIESLRAERSAPGSALKVYCGSSATNRSAELIDDDDVCVPKSPGLGKILAVCRTMRAGGKSLTHIGLFSSRGGGGRGGTRARMFDKVLADVDAGTYMTSSGPMTGMEIIEAPPDRLAMCPSDDAYVRAMSDCRVAADAAGGGRTAVYTDDNADGDRLWLAYGYAHGGAVPDRIDAKDLFLSSLKMLGVSDATAKRYENMRAEGGEEALVGNLRMLLSQPQRDLFMRVYRHNFDGDYDTRKMEQAAVFLSETDPSHDMRRLCLDVVRAMNGMGDHYREWGYELSWRHALLYSAMSTLGELRGHAVFAKNGGGMARRSGVFKSAKAAWLLYTDVLEHLFKKASIDIADDGGFLTIDAVIGSDGDGDGGGDGDGDDGGGGDGDGEAVRISGALYEILFGSTKYYTTECAGDGRLRLRGMLGQYNGKRRAQ